MGNFWFWAPQPPIFQVLPKKFNFWIFHQNATQYSSFEIFRGNFWFWAPDPLFCATLVPQIVPQFVALVAQSFFVPHFVAHIFYTSRVIPSTPSLTPSSQPLPLYPITSYYSSPYYFTLPQYSFLYYTPFLPILQPICLCFTVLKIQHSFQRIIHPRCGPILRQRLIFVFF